MESLRAEVVDMRNNTHRGYPNHNIEPISACKLTSSTIWLNHQHHLHVSTTCAKFLAKVIKADKSRAQNAAIDPLGLSSP
jgi:hypothetical protein